MRLLAYLFERGKENIYFLTLGIIGGAQVRLRGSHAGPGAAGHTCDVMHVQFPWCDIIDQFLDVHDRKMVHVKASGTLMSGDKKSNVYH